MMPGAMMESMAAARPLDGVLVVNKPPGWTSHDVVAKVRKILGGVKAGHTGTLDPQATGVLPVCVGRATRIVEYLAGDRKSYRAVLRLGVTTDSDDAEGKVIATGDPLGLSAEAIRAAVEGMAGPSLQTPPMYSAVKIGGERLYLAARRGETVQRPSRPIDIFRIALLGIERDLVTFEVDCSKGTYVRVLCRDIGERLGIGGHLVQLERTRSGTFGIEQSSTLDEIEESWRAGSIRDRLVPMARALPSVPWIAVGPEGARRVLRGMPVRDEDVLARGGEIAKESLVRILGPDEILMALARKASGKTYKMEKVLANE